MIDSKTDPILIPTRQLNTQTRIQNQTHFAVRYYRRVADSVARRIIRANHGRWPSDLPEWQEVARRYRYQVLIVMPMMEAPGIDTSCYHYDSRTCIIEYTSDRRLLHKRIAHEISHGILHDGNLFSRTILEWPRSDEDCHLVARAVEMYVDSAFVSEGRSRPE